MKYFTILLLLMFIPFCSTDEDLDNRIEECNTTYLLSETYFDNDDLIHFGVEFIHVVSDTVTVHDVDLTRMENWSKGALKGPNKLYKPANIQFEFTGVRVLKVKEIEESMSVFSWYGRQYSKRNRLNVFVYPQAARTTFSGSAGGIPSTFMAIAKDYLYETTLSHEFGHMLGLYHTHKDDPTDGYTSHEGDFVCDTPKASYKRSEDEDCDPTYIRGDLTKEERELILCNIMSYSPLECRHCLTDSQIKRMRWTIENAFDLRNAVLFWEPKVVN